MANKSKAKGNTGEYRFAEIFTSIFGRNFKRNTSGSGAAFGGGNFSIKLKGRDTSQVLHDLGDIVPPTGYYVVSECKNYKEFEFHKLLTNKGTKTIIWDWIQEVRYDARFSEKFMLPHWLGFKITRRGEYICLPNTFFGEIFINVDFDYLVYNHRVKNEDGVPEFVERYYVFLR